MAKACHVLCLAVFGTGQLFVPWTCPWTVARVARVAPRALAEPDIDKCADLGGHGRLAKGDGNGIFVEIHSFFMIVHEYSSMNHDVLMICFFVWQPDL